MEKDSNDSFSRGLNSPRDSDCEESFVKKVRSRVSGFIPSTLSKWFKGSDKASVRTRDELENDDEDTFHIQPPSKRVKRPDFNAQDDADNTLFVEPTAGPSGLHYKKASPAVSFNNLYSTHKDTDDEESTSGYSSMARIGSKEKQPEAVVNSNVNNKPINPVTNSTPATTSRVLNIKRNTNNASEGTPERSLFVESSLNHSLNSSLRSRRPSFNTSIGSPHLIDKTLSTKRIVNSPFYKGRTIYGGAAAYTSRFLNNSSTSEETSKSLMKAPLTLKPSNEPVLMNGNTTLSKTAKRILDTLEQFTTPVLDAKKIPNPSLRGGLSSFNNNNNNNSSKQGGEGLLAKYSGANPYLIREPKRKALTNELQVPTVPDLLKMKLKEKLQDSTVNVRQISKSVLNAVNTVPTTHTHTNKIRNKITATRQRKQQQDNEEVDTNTVILPEAKLPITDLPKFDFGLPFSPVPSTTVSTAQKPSNTPEKEKKTNNNNKATTQQTATSSSQPQSSMFMFKNTTQTMTLKTKTTVSLSESSQGKLSSSASSNIFGLTSGVASNSPMFKTVVDEKLEKGGGKVDKASEKEAQQNVDEWKFANPLIICQDGGNKAAGVKAINSFVFRTPEEKSKSASSTSKSTFQGFNFKAADVPVLKKRVNGEHTAGNKSQALIQGGSVMDVLGKNNNQQQQASKGFGAEFTLSKSSGKWECTSCLVRNNDCDLKCVACTANKPSSSSSSTTTTQQTPINSGFGLGFKTQANSTDKTWECQTCLIRNKNDVNKCVACEAAKPLAALNQSNNSSTWECKTCLIRNKNDLSKCAACEAAKPCSSSSSSSLSVGNSSHSFGDKFKPASNTWECNICMIRNAENLLKCAACETPKPGAKSTTLTLTTQEQTNKPQFSFGIPASSQKITNPITFKPPSDTWECTTCLIRNKKEDVKCVACETPNNSASSSSSSMANKGFGDKFKKPQTWECPTCMIRNDDKLVKCAACECARPGVVGANVPLKSSFGEQFKMSNKEWECSSCLVRNPDDNKTCVCCNSAKPNSSSSTTTSTSMPPPSTKNTVPTFTFGVGGKTTTSGFTFGIKPSTDGEQSSNKSKEASIAAEIFGDAKKAAAGNNTSTSSLSTSTSGGMFSFGIPDQKKTTTSSKEVNGPSSTSTSSSSLSTSTSTVANGASTLTSTAAPPTFAFNPPKQEVKKSESSSTPIVFGAKSTSLAPSTVSSNIPPAVSTTLPVFGSSSLTSTSASSTLTTKPAVAASATPTPTPVFGSGSGNEKSLPTFGSSSSLNTAKSEGFSFAKPSLTSSTPALGSTAQNKTSSSGFGGTPTPVFGSSTSGGIGGGGFGGLKRSSTQQGFGGGFNASTTSASTSTSSSSNIFGAAASSQGQQQQQQPSEKLFKFGGGGGSSDSSSSSKPAGGNTATAAPPSFSFGQTGAASTNSSNNATTSVNANTKPVFGFGASSSTLSTSSATASSTPGVNKPFVFGGSSTPGGGSATTFGSVSAQQSGAQNGAFNFGAAASTSAPKSGFNFGAAAASSAPTTQFGAPAAAGGTSSSSGAASTPTFNFGAASNTTSGAFTFGASGSASGTTPSTFNNGNPAASFSAGGPEKPQRIIKRAMRRTQR